MEEELLLAEKYEGSLFFSFLLLLLLLYPFDGVELLEEDLDLDEDLDDSERYLDLDFGTVFEGDSAGDDSDRDLDLYL